MAQRPGAKYKAERREAEAKASGYSSDDNLDMLVDYFEDAEEVTNDSRRLSERDRDYYDNKQLTAKEKKVLAKRGQPDIIINRIQTKVNFLLGYEASQRTDPKGYPRTPADEDASEACSDALRYIRDDMNLGQTFSQVWENMLIEGFGGAEFSIAPDDETGGEIMGGHVHWDRLFYDPHSREADFADARYLGMVVWMDKDEALAQWPEAEQAIEMCINGEQGKTYDDRPAWKQWAISGRRPRVRIVQMYYKKGPLWHWCIFTKGGKITGGEVPYKDEKGRSLCPLIMQSAFVDRENMRYGFVRALIGPQDEINKRRSKMLHASMVRQVKMTKGAVDDVDEIREQIAKSDGIIEINPGFEDSFAVLDNQVQFQHQAELLSHATREIDLMGPNAVMQGKGERGASGRAKLVDQQGGQIEIYRLVDRHNHFKRRVYQLLWAMVRQYWTDKKWIRVTDDERNVKFVGLNKPVTMADDLIKQAIDEGVPEEEAKAQIQQQAQQDPNIAAQLQQIVRMENVPAEMEMDIILEEVPDAANLQQEQFEILAQLAQAGIKFPPEVYIKTSALRDKKQLMDILEKAQADPMNQAANEAQMEKLVAEIEKLRAEVTKTQASARQADAAAIKTMAEADMLDAQIGSVIQPQVIPAQAPMPMMHPAPQQMMQPEMMPQDFGPPPDDYLSQMAPYMPMDGSMDPENGAGYLPGGVDPYASEVQPLEATNLLGGPPTY
jgi:hypothetical protein